MDDRAAEVQAIKVGYGERAKEKAIRCESAKHKETLDHEYRKLEMTADSPAEADPATQNLIDRREFIRAAGIGAAALGGAGFAPLFRQDTMFDPPVKLGIPFIINLYTDPREENPTADTWVVTPMLKIVGAFNATTKDNPLIPMGTPDPYAPPGK